MIGFLRGQVIEAGLDTALLDVQGVGYELHCSSGTLGGLAPGETTQLYVYTHVREDALQLFGFQSPLEKRMFLSLLDVHGIGPKMAIKILSASAIENLVELIEAGDVKALTQLPKVGKKTAEQLVLSLRGKLAIGATDLAGRRPVPGKSVPLRWNGNRGQVMSALVNLGFRPQDVEPVVGGLAEDIEIEVGIRESLRALSGSFA